VLILLFYRKEVSEIELSLKKEKKTDAE
jgi:hypothetical protein